ncbi:MAG: DUF1961 family protein [Verrucomicrobiota bacterium]
MRFFIVSFLLITLNSARAVSPVVVLPLDGSFAVQGASLAQTGPYRFLRLNGRTGYHPTSLKTVLELTTTAHQQPSGSMVLWVAPLETLTVATVKQCFVSKDTNAQEYALVADALPINDRNQSIFGWYWRSAWYPTVIAKFVAGRAKWDFELTPQVLIEHLPLSQGQWYQMALTWNRDAQRMRLYVNGILAGTVDYPFQMQTPNPKLFLGTTAMAFSGFQIYDQELTGRDIAGSFAAARPQPAAEVTKELQRLFTIQPKPRAKWKPGTDWRLESAWSFTNTADLTGWVQQGCLEPGYEMKERRITPEGLLLETPEQIGLESRMYLWSPRSYEGDLAVQFEFRPERNFGLALLVLQASGMQREDFINDHPPRTTGAMTTIIGDRVRNYHWEFFRRTGDVRADVGSQVLIKNPWNWGLGTAALPPIATNCWHTLLFVQEGAKLRCALDGRWVMEATDSPTMSTGPVFNSGRIGLRLMYRTRMRFRDLKVWNRQAEWRTHEQN